MKGRPETTWACCCAARRRRKWSAGRWWRTRFDYAAQEVSGRGIRAEQGGRRAAYAVLQRLSAAVLLPDDGRNGRGEAAGGHRDGDAGGQREPGGGVDHAGGDG